MCDRQRFHRLRITWACLKLLRLTWMLIKFRYSRRLAPSLRWQKQVCMLLVVSQCCRWACDLPCTEDRVDDIIALGGVEVVVPLLSAAAAHLDDAERCAQSRSR